MIIIRSQNKEVLLKAEDVYLNQELEKLGLGYFIYSKDYPLGEYKSKERATEVLDKIQKEIIRGLSRDYLDGNFRVFQNKVFEMPRE